MRYSIKNIVRDNIVLYGIYLFFYEYLPNHIVNHIPIVMLRYAYMKYILQIDMKRNSYVHMGQYIYSSLSKLKIGHNTVINSDCILDRRGKLIIGDNVNISREVAIYTGGHIINDKDFSYYSKSVEIGDYVWIGTRAMIMPGVIIGKGAVILPGAIVTKNVNPYAIVGGVPAKQINTRTKELSYTLTWRSIFL